MDDAVAELEAEQADIDAVLAPLSDQAWLTPTPAVGWDIRDQVSHLADVNDVAYDTATGGPRSLNIDVARFASPEEFTESACITGRAMAPAEVLAWWRTSSARVNDRLRAMDPRERVPWGLGMSARTLATARLMEHWAHAEDIRAALGLAPNATPRLRSIAWLVTNALPYAFSYAGVTPPAGALRVEVTFGGDTWTFGPDDATDLIEGDALEYCRLGIQRTTADQTSLKAHGDLAAAALRHARAFL